MFDSYNTLNFKSEGIYKEKGSKFLSFAYPVHSEEEIKTILSEIKDKYYDARHHCYAYILGADKSIYRMNDDGEPSSTAGKPIHGQLLSFELTNVLIVVVRYFGGTKLGVSGLINAYKEAARDAILNNEIIEKTVEYELSVQFDYFAMNDVMKFIKDERLNVTERDFGNVCMIKLIFPKKDYERLFSALSSISSVSILDDGLSASNSN